MKRFFFIIIILVTLLAALVVIPSFKLNVAGKTFVWPEIDYSQLFGKKDNVNFSFKRGGDFDSTTVVKMLVESGQEEDAKKISEIARQRIEIMGTDSSVSYFKEKENYYIKLTVAGTGSLTDKQIFALTNSQKIQILKEKDTQKDDSGQPVVSQDSPFIPVSIDYETAKSANLKFDSSIGRYIVEVEFDPASLSGVNETLSAPSAGAFIGQDPIAAIVTGAASTVAKMKFAASSEVDRKEASVLLSLLATKTYPMKVTEVSREVFAPQRGEKDMFMYSLAFTTGFAIIGAFFFFTSKSIWKFMVFSLALFTVFTLALFKMPVFEVEITSGSLLGFSTGFIAAAGLLYYTVLKLKPAQDESTQSAKEKVLSELAKKYGAELRIFLLFILFLLIVLNMIYGKVGNDISVGFGYSIVTLLIMSLLFMKNIFWNLYVSPINFRINVLEKNNKK